MRRHGNSQRNGQFGRKSGQAVYIIGTGRGPLKIGISESPYKRLAAIQTSHPERLSVLYAKSWAGVFAQDIETEVHRFLDEHRTRGEWFDVSFQTAVDAIESVAAKLCLETVRVHKARFHTTECPECAELKKQIRALKDRIALLIGDKAA